MACPGELEDLGRRVQDAVENRDECLGIQIREDIRIGEQQGLGRGGSAATVDLDELLRQTHKKRRFDPVPGYVADGDAQLRLAHLDKIIEIPSHRAAGLVDAAEFDNLVMLADDNQNFIREIIGNFETDAFEDIRGMEASIARHDWHSFKDYAHALKGSALYLGLGQLAHLSLTAQNIEREEFEHNGIACILTIRSAADDAIHSLKKKERMLKKTG